MEKKQNPEKSNPDLEGTIVTRRGKGKAPTAFTLIELLVVIAIIALLLAIIVPALKEAKRQAQKIVCKSNIKQNNLALLIFATSNEDRLPLQRRGAWLHDLSYETTDFMIEEGGLDEKSFYCPSTMPKDNLWPLFWQWSQSWPLAPDIYRGPEPATNRHQEYRVAGYFWLMEYQGGRGWQPMGQHNFLLKTTLFSSDAADGEGGRPVKGPGNVPLCTDQVFTDDNQDFEGSTNGGLWPGYQILDRTNHFYNGKLAGTNIGFLDGHVDWRTFQDMQQRNNWLPYHWW